MPDVSLLVHVLLFGLVGFLLGRASSLRARVEALEDGEYSRAIRATARRAIDRCEPSGLPADGEKE